MIILIKFTKDNVHLFSISLFDTHVWYSINLALMPTDNKLIRRRNAHLFAIPPLSKVTFLFDGMHCHDYHNHEAILIMGINSDSNEIAHMIEKFLSIFLINDG